MLETSEWSRAYLVYNVIHVWGICLRSNWNHRCALLRPNKRIRLSVHEINQSRLLLFKDEGFTRYRVIYRDTSLSYKPDEFFRHQAIILLWLICIVFFEILRNNHRIILVDLLFKSLPDPSRCTDWATILIRTARSAIRGKVTWFTKYTSPTA